VILVAGATGILGLLVVQKLVEAGKPVRALVRATADQEKVTRLRNLGANLVVGDLKDQTSLRAACEGVKTVISTATSIVSRQADDDIESVDRNGNIALFKVAAEAGAEHEIFVSFQPHELAFPLQDAKRAVENVLRKGSVAYTIFKPTYFTELWLGPALLPIHGFDFSRRFSKLAGSGENKLSWISIDDVARFVVGAVDNHKARGGDFIIGGPEALSPNEVVQLLEGSGEKWQVEHISEEGLRAGAAGAPNPFERSFAALLASFADGYVADSTAALAAVPITTTPVRAYIDRVVRQADR
jgi:uncharacterized protein YbjT (DUF2867 family)